MIVLSICLTDIPADKITKSEKNGKKYLSIVVDEKKDGKDQYGNTHGVYVNQSKEEREAKEKKVYIGNGKEYVFNKPVQTQTTYTPPNYNPAPETPDDLPF